MSRFMSEKTESLRRRGDARARRRCLTAVAVAVTMFVGACGYTGPTAYSVVRNFTWFEYANGEDIRDACRDGDGEHYRFIYNARFHEHLRWYDLVRPDAAAPAALTARMSRRGQTVFRFDLSFPLDDPASPFRDSVETTTVSTADVEELVAAMDRSGAFDPGPDGLRLPSNSFYWLVMACRDGRFTFSAYHYDTDRFEAVGFDRPLFRLDPLTDPAPGAEAMRPQDIAAGRHGPPGERTHEQAPFVLEVGDNGLVTVF